MMTEESKARIIDCLRFKKKYSSKDRELLTSSDNYNLTTRARELKYSTPSLFWHLETRNELRVNAIWDRHCCCVRKDACPASILSSCRWNQSSQFCVHQPTLCPDCANAAGCGHHERRRSCFPEALVASVCSEIH